jgi:hypothetical protein
VGDRVVFNKGFNGGAWVTDLASRPRRVSSLAYARRVGRRPAIIVGGTTGGDGSSETVVDLGSGEVLWSKPGWDLGAVSPSGGQVMGMRFRRGGATAMAVFDVRNGRIRTRFPLPAELGVRDAVWEDETHLLMVATQGRTTAIVRADHDGTLERATPTVRAPAHASAFVLTERP